MITLYAGDATMTVVCTGERGNVRASNENESAEQGHCTDAVHVHYMSRL